MATKETPHSNRGHAVTSPSSASRWLNCTGSLILSEGMKSESSPAAQEGTKFHEWCQKSLEEGLEVLEELDDKYMASYVESYYNFIQKLDNKVGGFTKSFVEDRVALNSHIHGTADFAGLYARGRKAVIVDAKYTKHYPVMAEENPQLACYVASFRKQHKLGLDQATVFIVQPRVSEEEGPIQQWKLTKKDLDAWEKKLVSGAKLAHLVKARKKEPTFKYGSWCHFCLAQTKCPTFIETVENKSLVKLTSSPKLPEPKSLSLEQISKILEAKKEIESFLKNTSAYALNMAKEGNKVPGFKLVEGRSTRKWLPNTEKVAEFLQELGVEEPFNKKIKGLGDIEEIVGRGKIAAVTTKPPGAISLAPVEDKRMEVVVGRGSLDMLGDVEVK